MLRDDRAKILADAKRRHAWYLKALQLEKDEAIELARATKRAVIAADYEEAREGARALAHKIDKVCMAKRGVEDSALAVRKWKEKFDSCPICSTATSRPC